MFSQVFRLLTSWTSSSPTTFEELPTEMILHILSYLPLNSLLTSSLVSRHWNEVASVLIVRKVMLNFGKIKPADVEILQNSVRDYWDVAIFLREWEEQQVVFDGCVEKLRPIKVRLQDVEAEELYHFCKKNQPLLENVKVLIFVGKDCKAQAPKSYSLDFPKLEQLIIAKQLPVSESIALSLNVPKLKYLDVDERNSVQTSLSKILNCQQLMNMKCNLYNIRTFHKLFDGSLLCLSRLELTVKEEVNNFHFLNNLPALKWIGLKIRYPIDRMDTLSAAVSDAIANCRQLECIRYAVMNDASEVTSLCRLNLSKLVKQLIHLNRLELSRMHVTIDQSSMCLPSVTFLTFIETTFHIGNSTILRLDAPNLKHAFISVHNLSQIIPVGKWPLVGLHVDIDDVPLRDALDTHLVPFMTNFDGVEQLMLHRWLQHNILDEDFSPSVQLPVQLLHLRSLKLRLECFERISTWKQLRTLAIENCIFDTRGACKAVQLSHLTLYVKDNSTNGSFEESFSLDGTELLGGGEGRYKSFVKIKSRSRSRRPLAAEV